MIGRSVSGTWRMDDSAAVVVQSRVTCAIVLFPRIRKPSCPPTETNTKDTILTLSIVTVCSVGAASSETALVCFTWLEARA